jgi:hypothetical protein
MNISPEEAAQALQQIRASQIAMRHIIRSYRGHYYLWLWGAAWMAMAVVRMMDRPAFYRTINWITLAGIIASMAIGFSQSGKIGAKIDRRFIAVCAALLAFGYGVWPLFFRLFSSFDQAFAYQELLFMQLYIVGGIWFDNSLLWIGLTVAAIVLVGFFLFPAFFWVAMLLSGATLVASGFYVRTSWC